MVRLFFPLEPDQTKVYGFELGESLEAGANLSSSADSFLIYLREKGVIPPAFRVSGTLESRLFSGLEHVYKPTVYEGVATGFTPDPGGKLYYKILRQGWKLYLFGKRIRSFYIIWTTFKL
jgi:hypothetical protein